MPGTRNVAIAIAIEVEKPVEQEAHGGFLSGARDVLVARKLVCRGESDGCLGVRLCVGRPLSQIFVELACAFGFKTAFVLKNAPLTESLVTLVWWCAKLLRAKATCVALLHRMGERCPVPVSTSMPFGGFGGDR